MIARAPSSSFSMSLFVMALVIAWLTCASVAFAQTKQQALSAKQLLKKIERQPQVAVPVVITRKGDEVMIQTSDKPVRVANPQKLSTPVRQLPVYAELSKSAAGEVMLKNVSLQATKSWQAVAPGLRKQFQEVEQAQTKLRDVARQALAPEATTEHMRALRDSVVSTQGTIVNSYLKLPVADRGSQRVLVEQYREVHRAGKALYGYERDDRYPPQTYTQIFANSRGAFALHRKGEPKPRCSAVLIADNLALTNNHCILSDLPEDLEAVFDYEDDLAGNHLSTHAFPVQDFLVETEEDRDHLDFVLLKLGSDGSGQLPGAVYQPQCLSTVRVRRDDPVYVIGFPLGDPRTVSDNAYVYFPFRVTPEEFAELEILVRSEFDTKDLEDKSYADGKLKEFSDSYRKTTYESKDVYEYYSTRFGNQPTIGADCDTFHGNSGSPVYQRHTHTVVGLLFDGQEDLSEPWKPGWSAHEAILPMSEIIKRLDAVRANWREEPGVCVKS